MGIFVNLAKRNVFRHVNRNLIIGISIALSVGLFFAVLCISNGVENQLVFNKVQIETGVVSFSVDEDLLETADEAAQKEFEALYKELGEIPSVNNVRERIHSRALLSNGDKTVDINLRGLDWSKEQPLFTSLVFNVPPESDFREQPGIIISQSIADKLKVGQNEYCSVLVQTVQGTLNLEEYPVLGILQNISGWANMMVFMDINTAKPLINSGIASDVLLDSENLGAADEILVGTKSALTDRFGNDMDAETYLDRSAIASTVSNANKYGFLSIVIFLQIISFFGIGFVVMNNVIERKKEIGTLLAIGYKPIQIRGLFIYETLFIGLIASLVGLLLFGAVLFYYSRNGIFLGETASLIFGGTLLKPQLSISVALLGVLIGILYPLISAFWSTRKIRKAEPVSLLYDR